MNCRRLGLIAASMPVPLPVVVLEAGLQDEHAFTAEDLEEPLGELLEATRHTLQSAAFEEARTSGAANGNGHLAKLEPAASGAGKRRARKKNSERAERVACLLAQLAALRQPGGALLQGHEEDEREVTAIAEELFARTGIAVQIYGR